MILLTNDNARNEIAVVIAPLKRKGRLRPQRERELSDIAPTIGCTKTPHIGAIAQIREDCDFVIPKEERYAEPCEKMVDHTN